MGGIGIRVYGTSIFKAARFSFEKKDTGLVLTYLKGIGLQRLSLNSEERDWRD